MSDVNLSSILVDNKKKNQLTGATISEKNTEQGIDFKNDTVVVSAQNELFCAEDLEKSETAKADSSRMELAHVDEDYNTLMTDYQRVLMQEQLARSATESLTVTQASVFEQLSFVNQEVASLENKKANSEKAVAQSHNLITSLTKEKSEKLAAHDAKISGLNSQISANNRSIQNLNKNKSSASKTISDARSTKSNLEAQLASAQTDADKAAIREAIARQDAIIAKAEQDISNTDAKIAELQAQISNFETQISNERKLKQETREFYSPKIEQATAQLAENENNVNIFTEQLANAVYKQTGLTMQEANISQMIKEAQIYEQSVNAMLKSLEQQIETTEEKQENVTKHKDVAEKKEKDAMNATEMKREKLTEAEIQTKTHAKQKQKNNSFLA